jgi:hypothetical protein
MLTPQHLGWLELMFRTRCAIIAPTWIHSCQSSWWAWRPLLAKSTGDLCLPSPGLLRFRENGSHQADGADACVGATRLRCARLIRRAVRPLLLTYHIREDSLLCS